MHNSKKRRVAEQVKHFRSRFVQSAGAALGDAIPRQLLMQWVTEECGRWRERLYGPLQTLLLFIEQVLGADHSCQDTVARGVSARVARGQAMCSLNSGPYCKARQRLALGLIERLGREVGSKLCSEQPAHWLWRGRQVKLVDGTTVSMPDTPENQACFPQSREQKPGLGFPLARLVAIVSLSCGAVLEWASGPCEGKSTGETALMWQLAHKLKPGDIVIADRFYTSYFLIALLRTLGVDIVMRQHQRRHTDFRRGWRQGVRDHIVMWDRPPRPAWMSKETYVTMPESMTMREVRSGGWTLVSTLLDAPQVSKQELVELYCQRWKIELDLRAIKSIMQMDVLRCKSPPMVQKEIAVHLLAYNLVRSVMGQAAYMADVLPRQLSFKAALQMLRAFEENLRYCPRGRLSVQHACLIAGIAQCRLPHRPGRVEPRAVKRRPKPRRLLTTPRKVLREKLVKQQQRRIDARLR